MHLGKWALVHKSICHNKSVSLQRATALLIFLCCNKPTELPHCNLSQTDVLEGYIVYPQLSSLFSHTERKKEQAHVLPKVEERGGDPAQRLRDTPLLVRLRRAPWRWDWNSIERGCQKSLSWQAINLDWETDPGRCYSESIRKTASCYSCCRILNTRALLKSSSHESLLK